MFTIWYLKDKQYVRQDDRSDFLITAEGVDYVEANLLPTASCTAFSRRRDAA